MLKDRVADRLHALRMSQSDLCRKASLSPAFVSDLMCGRKTSVRANNLARLAEALNVPTDYLLAPTRLAALNALSAVAEDRDDCCDADPGGSERHAPQHDASQQSVTQPVRGLPLPVWARPPARTMRSWAPEEIVQACDPTGSGAWAPLFSSPDPDRPDEIIVGADADGRLRLPPQLLGTGTYAIRVAGTGMAPRYWPGELVFCTPDRSILGSKYVAVVQQRDEAKRITLGRIRAYRGGAMSICNEADQNETIIPYDAEVIAIHRIVLSCEDWQA